MAFAVESSGTQTTVLNTEHTLAAPTASAIRMLEVDLGAMVAGDVVELRIKKATLSGGTVRGVAPEPVTFVGPQDDIVQSVAVPSGQGHTFTLKQTAGVARSFPWCVYTL